VFCANCLPGHYHTETWAVAAECAVRAVWRRRGSCRSSECICSCRSTYLRLWFCRLLRRSESSCVYSCKSVHLGLPLAAIRSELGLGPFVPLSINKTTDFVKVVVGRDPASTLPTSIVNRLKVAQDELRSHHLEISQLKGASRVQATVTTKPAVAPAAPKRNPLAPATILSTNMQGCQLLTSRPRTKIRCSISDISFASYVRHDPGRPSFPICWWKERTALFLSSTGKMAILGIIGTFGPFSDDITYNDTSLSFVNCRLLDH
jgi:hypothetical protein